MVLMTFIRLFNILTLWWNSIVRIVIDDWRMTVVFVDPVVVVLFIVGICCWLFVVTPPLRYLFICCCIVMWCWLWHLVIAVDDADSITFHLGLLLLADSCCSPQLYIVVGGRHLFVDTIYGTVTTPIVDYSDPVPHLHIVTVIVVVQFGTVIVIRSPFVGDVDSAPFPVVPLEIYLPIPTTNVGPPDSWRSTVVVLWFCCYLGIVGIDVINFVQVRSTILLLFAVITRYIWCWPGDDGSHSVTDFVYYGDDLGSPQLPCWWRWSHWCTLLFDDWYCWFPGDGGDKLVGDCLMIDESQYNSDLEVISDDAPIPVIYSDPGDSPIVYYTFWLPVLQLFLWLFGGDDRWPLPVIIRWRYRLWHSTLRPSWRDGVTAGNLLLYAPWPAKPFYRQRQ